MNRRFTFGALLGAIALSGCDPQWDICGICPVLCESAAIDDSEPEAPPSAEEPADDPAEPAEEPALIEEPQLIAVEITDDTPADELSAGRTTLLNFEIEALGQDFWLEEVNFRIETIDGPELQLPSGLWIVDRAGEVFLNDPLFTLVPPRVTAVFDDWAYPDQLAGAQRNFSFDAELSEDADLSGETATFRVCITSIAVLEPANWARHVVELNDLCGPELSFAY